jgi:outer membrane beta-barrel protein
MPAPTRSPRALLRSPAALFVLALALTARATEPVPSASLTGAADADVQLVHAVEKRPFTEAGRWELTLFAPVQVNTQFTFHAGAAFELAYHIRENLAAQVGVLWNPVAIESALAEEMLTKVNRVPTPAEALLLEGSVLAGLELMPIYGKINIFDGKILRFGIYLNAGLGEGKTRLELLAANEPGGRSFGDVGYRPMGALGVGGRVFLTERFTFRIEIRDTVFSAYVSRVNGCTSADAHLIAQMGYLANTRAGCDPHSFGDTEAAAKTNAGRTSQAIASPSADVVNNIAAYTGLSYLF